MNFQRTGHCWKALVVADVAFAAHGGRVEHCCRYTSDFVAALKDTVVDVVVVADNPGLHSGAAVAAAAVDDNVAVAVGTWVHPPIQQRHFV